ncbi:MAG: polysaccharide biosynthesis protein [Alphaproteobacteria bacterium]|nr:polysaccharide biosynthesis protein [Alphaproteobacteria bacterium]
MIYEFLTNLPRWAKRAILFSLDSLLVPSSLYVAFALRLDTLAPFVGQGHSWVLLASMTGIGVILIYAFGLHRIKLHVFEGSTITRIGLVSVLLLLLAVLLVYFFRLWAPRSVPIIFASIFFLTSVTARILGAQLLYFLQHRQLKGSAVPVVVYGAGAAGIQLVSALRQSPEINPIGFVDDNPSLHGVIVCGLKVDKPAKLEAMAEDRRIERIILAIPSAPQARQNEIMAKLTKLPCEVQVLPSFVEMVSGKGPQDSLRTVAPDELLGRDKVDLDIPDVAKAYAGRVIMVTGAGGSIGSELCRQLVSCRPAQIVLYEQSEFALYEIDRELRPHADAHGIVVTTRLGSITGKDRIACVLVEQRVDIILHAAAYKHVPLVEDNELEGARNNVLGTLVVAQAAQAAGVERFIMISTDKAVRPTNVMGATKRIAELILQDMQTRSKRTIYSMVRFGNVLGSSGSVLPLFQRQIANGGPVTVTHPEMTRFFMTIPEASRLVLLAGAYASGGDVFVLDMGEPVKILDVARQMIKLAGYRVKEEGAEDGDIEIEIVGLRPGEKLYEELLTDNDSLTATPHEKIMRAAEPPLNHKDVAAMLAGIKAALADNDREALYPILCRWVEGYARPGRETASR